ncbi:MAG: hypothetical protein GX036_08180 [Firmicutes bacterium]|jgi:hypothetical protein|nr:hypothetical protein [Bacillota bacterium]
MKKSLLFFCLASILLLAICPPGLASVVYEKNGFTINALEGEVGAVPYQVLVMFLPPTADGFTPNVNVQIQPFAGTMADYTALSKQQIENAGWKLLNQATPGKDVVILEFAGEAQGFGFHWYAKAVKDGDRVYLVTATASESYWAELAEQLKTTVDSFKLR